MNPRIDQPVIKLILRYLSQYSHLTSYQLAEILQIDVRNVRYYLKLLKTQEKIYIARYIKKQKGPAVPVWKLNLYGDEEDAEYPKALTKAETQRRRRLLIKELT